MSNWIKIFIAIFAITICNKSFSQDLTSKLLFVNQNKLYSESIFGKVLESLFKEETLKLVEQNKKLTKELSKLKGMGSKGADFLTFSNRWKNDSAYEGLSLEAAGAKYYGLASFANGGVISEPVFGVGRSGRSYLLGENGAEKISQKCFEVSMSIALNGNSHLEPNHLHLVRR